MIKIQLDELEIFNAVVQSSNFSDAGVSLGITASVVSRTIKKLEHKLDIALFNRTTRKIHLTQEGEWLYQKSKGTVIQARSIEDYFADKDKAPEGKIIVDAATPFALHAVSALIPKFQQLYPKIKVVLKSTESNIDLIHNKVDIAIRIGMLEDSSLRAKKLGNASRKLYASSDYLTINGTPTTPDELVHHQCIAFSAPEKLNTWPIADRRGNLIRIESSLQADNGEMIKQLAIMGAGIACLSSFTAKEDVQLGRLKSILDNHIQKHQLPIYAVYYAENEVTKRIRCFLDYLSEHISFE